MPRSPTVTASGDAGVEAYISIAWVGFRGSIAIH